MSQIPALLQQTLSERPFNEMVDAVQTHGHAPRAADITHHFSSGVYAKEMRIPAGFVAVSHKHAFDHMSILAQGHVQVRTESSSKVYVAPAVLEIKAGLNHAIHALADSVWFCVHATNETDETKVDQVLIQRDAA